MVFVGGYHPLLLSPEEVTSQAADRLPSPAQIKNVIYWYLGKIKQKYISGTKRRKTEIILQSCFKTKFDPWYSKVHMLLLHIKNTLPSSFDILKPGD